ncbi:hypothetical protein I4200191B4_20790 [Pseudoflavonifractor gallinarum]
MAVLLRDIIANGLCVVNVKRSESESESESESKYRPVAQISLRSFVPLVCYLLGSAFPKPC